MTLTLRARIILLFVPLLLVLSGLGGGMVLLGHRAEALWGLEQQARAAIVTLAGMIDAHGTPAPQALATVTAANDITGLRLFDAAGGQRLSIGTMRGPDPLLRPPATLVTLPDGLEDGTPVGAVAPLADGGWLALEMSTARPAAEAGRLRRVALALLAAGIMVGLTGALAVAGRIVRRLKALRRRMALLSAGTLESAPAVAGIREVEDLDDALRTMHSVLQARRERSERLCIENEQFRTLHDIVGTLAEATQPDIDALSGDRRIVARRVGGDAGQILRLIRAATGSHLLLGVIQLADPLERALRAGAVADLLEARLRDGVPPCDVLADIAAGQDRLLILSWDTGVATRKVEWRAGRLHGEDCAQTDILAVGLLTGGGERLLRQYMERFGDVALEARAADLSTILQRRCVGTYALVTIPAAGQQDRRHAGMEEIARLDMTLDSRIEEIQGLADAFDQFCEAHGIPSRPAFQFNLCFDELLTNVVQHGLDSVAGHPIKVSVLLTDLMLQAEIVDDGPAFDPLQRPPVDTEADIDDREIGGLGVHMVRTMMDMVSYRRVDGCNHFRFGQQVAGWKNDVMESE